MTSRKFISRGRLFSFISTALIAVLAVVQAPKGVAGEREFTPRASESPVVHEVRGRLMPRFNQAARPPVRVTRPRPRFNRAARPPLRGGFNRAARPPARGAFNRAAPRGFPRGRFSTVRRGFASRGALSKAFGQARWPGKAAYGFNRAHGKIPSTGRPRSFVTQRPMTFYRAYTPAPRGSGLRGVFGQHARGNAQGAWLMRKPPGNSRGAISRYALPPGNRATHIQKVVVPKGTLMTVSRAGPNWGRPGGGFQYRLQSQIPARGFGRGRWLRGGLGQNFGAAARRSPVGPIP